MKVIIYGASGQGRVTADLIRTMGKHDIFGFVDDDKSKTGILIDGVKVVGGRDILSTLCTKDKVQGVVLAVGDGNVRASLFELCRKTDLEIIGFIHPSAAVSPGAQIHPSAMVWPHAVINVGATIGMSTIVNSNSTVEHDVALGSFVHVAPGAILCGNCSVGDHTWIGAGAVILQGVRVGKSATIGAGSVVLADVPDDTTGFGVPFKARTSC